MPLSVPPPQIATIKALLELPDDKVNELLTALDSAGPQFNVEDLSKEVSRSVEIPRGLTRRSVEIVGSLYRAFGPAQPISGLGEFLDKEVHPAMKRAEIFSPEREDSQWAKLREFFLTALSLERTVGTTVKAGPVLTAHERIFAGAKIMTDLRPIYHRDASEKPDAALIVHMLRITQRDDDGNRSDLYFALDSNDIRLMRDVIERALQKEVTLKGIIDPGVKVLDVKATY